MPWSVSLAAFVVTFVCIGIRARYSEFDFRKTWVLSAASLACCAGVILQQFGVSRLLQDSLGRGFVSAAFVLGSTLIGSGTPFLYIEVVRQFVPLGFRPMFICAVSGCALSSLLIAALQPAPLAIRVASGIFVNILILVCLLLSVARDDSGGRPPSPRPLLGMRLPWKLLVTAVVQGCAFGSCLSFLGNEYVGEGTEALLFQTIGMLCAATLLALLMKFTNFDFNCLIYKVGFAILGIGTLLLSSLESPWVGMLVTCMGYRVIDLLMFIIAVFLASSRRISMNWVTPLPTAMLYIGMSLGYASRDIAMEIGLAPIPETIGELCTFDAMMGAFVLLTAILLLDPGNPNSGWGTMRPAEEEGVRRLLESEAQDAVAKRLELSPRQREVFNLLLKGDSRKEIADQLFLSEETVKVHIHILYQKAQTHSVEGLKELVRRELQKQGKYEED
jgi:DNA-binding CsgD family transcriptional regulator